MPAERKGSEKPASQYKQRPFCSDLYLFTIVEEQVVNEQWYFLYRLRLVLSETIGLQYNKNFSAMALS